MRICICNDLDKATIQRAIAGGADSPGAVYRALDSIPACGKCLAPIRALIAQARAETLESAP